MVGTNRLPPRPSEMMGRDANGYVIDATIGEGGMGAVFSGYCSLLDKRAAIKVMLAEFSDQPELVERFAREARAAAAIRDFNIIDVYSAGRFREDNRPFIVMPFIEGGNLAGLCKQMGPLPVDVLAVIMLQVCSGLDAVHEKGIVHRDIKAQNILVTPLFRRQYHVYIVDFGIAKLLAHALAQEQITRTRAVLGTAGCMAPEQSRGDPNIDARADVYALGMVMYRALTGRPVYSDANVYAFFEEQAKRVPFPRPRELRPDIPQALEDVIMACLEHDRNKRPESVRQVAHMIARAVPNGERLLEVFATRLSAGAKMAPDAPTFAGGVEASIAHAASIQTSRSRAPRFAALGAAVSLGAALGGGAFALATREDKSRTAENSERAVLDATVPNANVASTGPTPPQDAPVAVSATATPPVDAATVTINAAPDAGVAVLPPRPDAGTSRVVHQTQRAPVTGAGTLVVKVKPFAEVYVNGEHIGTTPVRKSFDAGAIDVRLVSGEKEEKLRVRINPGKQTTIQRTW